MKHLNEVAKNSDGSGIWEFESVESYLGNEDAHDVMCMDAHCWSPKGERNSKRHPQGDPLKEAM